jgi:hypothetical protein
MKRIQGADPSLTSAHPPSPAFPNDTVGPSTPNFTWGVTSLVLYFLLPYLASISAHVKVIDYAGVHGVMVVVAKLNSIPAAACTY